MKSRFSSMLCLPMPWSNLAHFSLLCLFVCIFFFNKSSLLAIASANLPRVLMGLMTIALLLLLSLQMQFCNFFLLLLFASANGPICLFGSLLFSSSSSSLYGPISLNLLLHSSSSSSYFSFSLLHLVVHIFC